MGQWLCRQPWDGSWREPDICSCLAAHPQPISALMLRWAPGAAQQTCQSASPPSSLAALERLAGHLGWPPDACPWA